MGSPTRRFRNRRPAIRNGWNRRGRSPIERLLGLRTSGGAVGSIRGEEAPCLAPYRAATLALFPNPSRVQRYAAARSTLADGHRYPTGVLPAAVRACISMPL